MARAEAEKRYGELFDDAAKIRAFDQIAERYYFANFGSMSKADLEVLLFSLYLERILDCSQEDMVAYSDYTLSKYLGITQPRISNLKVKKELIYPYPEFDWRKALLRISKQAVYEDGKIKLYIPDRNLYVEVKNAIETCGGFVETRLTANLLQVHPAYFLDLMTAISGENREAYRKKIWQKMQEKNADQQYLERVPLGKWLQHKTPEAIFALMSAVAAEFSGSLVSQIIFNVLGNIRL